MHAAHPRQALAMTTAAVGRLAVALVVALLVAHGAEAPVSLSSPREQAGELRLYRLEEGRVRALVNGQAAAAGDRVQLVFHAGGREHGVIFSVDGDGAVTLHHPARADASTRLESDQGPLPASFVLDDAPAFERFYFVTADAPLDPRAVLQRADDGRMCSFLLVKQVRAPDGAEVR